MAKTRPPTDAVTMRWVDVKFTLPVELKAALKQRSAEEGISTQVLVRRVLALAVMDGRQGGVA